MNHVNPPKKPSKSFLSSNQVDKFVNCEIIGVSMSQIPGGYVAIDYIAEEENKELFPNRGLNAGEEIDFKYIVNAFGFRSEHFKRLNHDNYNILYSGCSVTFGCGLPSDLTWTGMLDSKIQNYFSDKKIVKSYNLGIRGSDYMTMIRNIYTFINLCGKPDLICLLLPELTRSFIFNGSEYIKFFQRPHNDLLDPQNPIKKYHESIVYENIFFNFSSYIHALESFCNEVGISFLWSTWVGEDMFIMNKINFKNYISSEIPLLAYMNHPDKNRNLMAKLESNTQNLPYWAHGRDLEHPGTLFSKKTSELYYDKWINHAEKN